MIKNLHYIKSTDFSSIHFYNWGFTIPHTIQRPAVPFCTIISCKEFWLKILWSIRFRLHTLFLLGGDTFVLTCLPYIQQASRDENIPHSMPNEGINPEFFYFGEIVLQYNTLLLNEGIQRALKGKKLRLKNILLLPLIFEEMNSF